jgi:hypothetical protein
MSNQKLRVQGESLPSPDFVFITVEDVDRAIRLSTALRPYLNAKVAGNRERNR